MKNKPRPSIEALFRQLTATLEKSGFPEPVKHKVPLGLSRCVREFQERPENRGKRCIKRAPMRRVRKTMKHLTQSVRHAYAHNDPNVRTKAKELVRSIQCQSFEETERRARDFNGLLRKAGRRLNEQKRKKARRRIKIGNLDLVQQNSVEQLKRTGRILGLCVARGDSFGREYHARLRSGESEFFRVHRNGKPIGLIEIDNETLNNETRRVRKASGYRNKTLKLKPKKMSRILRALNATADDIEAFVRVGAVSFVLDSNPKDMAPIQVGDHDYSFWFDPQGKGIAVQKRRTVDAMGKRKGSPKWSVFERVDPARRTRLGEWREACWHRDAMDIGELVDLLIRSPELAKRIREAFHGRPSLPM